jgi:hypothetical protein
MAKHYTTMDFFRQIPDALPYWRKRKHLGPKARDREFNRTGG